MTSPPPPDLHSLPSSPSLRLRAVFDAFDQNHDGLLTIQELSSWMQKLGLLSNPDALLRVVDECDCDKDQCLNFQEFLALNKILENEGREGVAPAEDAGSSVTVDSKSALESEMKEAFRVFDKDGNGQITPNELHATLSDLGLLAEGTNLSRIYSMIKKVDSDGDGQVSFVEFQNMMKGK